MSTRPLIAPRLILKAADMSTDQFFATDTDNLSLVSYTLVWTGTPSGTFTIEACNDAVMQVNGIIVSGSGTWEPLPFTDSTGTVVTSLSAGGTSGSAFIGLSSLPSAFLRLHYATDSSAGNLTVTMSAKVA